MNSQAKLCAEPPAVRTGLNSSAGDQFAIVQTMTGVIDGQTCIIPA